MWPFILNRPKKIDTELMLYFPSLFNDADVKEYFDLLKRRAMEILNNIIKGKKEPDKVPLIEKLNMQLINLYQAKDL